MRAAYSAEYRHEGRQSAIERNHQSLCTDQILRRHNGAYCPFVTSGDRKHQRRGNRTPRARHQSVERPPVACGAGDVSSSVSEYWAAHGTTTIAAEQGCDYDHHVARQCFAERIAANSRALLRRLCD